MLQKCFEDYLRSQLHQKKFENQPFQMIAKNQTELIDQEGKEYSSNGLFNPGETMKILKYHFKYSFDFAHNQGTAVCRILEYQVNQCKKKNEFEIFLDNKSSILKKCVLQQKHQQKENIPAHVLLNQDSKYVLSLNRQLKQEQQQEKRINIPLRWEHEAQNWVEEKKNKQKRLDQKYYFKLQLLCKALSKRNAFLRDNAYIEELVQNMKNSNYQPPSELIHSFLPFLLPNDKTYKRSIVKAAIEMS